MLYRRKILLALVESFGGSLLEKDLSLLLFLFCSQRGKQFYDFFSTPDGPYSLVLHQDKKRLTALQFLVPGDFFQIGYTQSFASQIAAKDNAALHSFAKEMGKVRGEDLFRRFSQAMQNSMPDEYNTAIIKREKVDIDVSYRRNLDLPCLFTLGYEGLSIDAYLNILLTHHISTVIDVRKNSLSRKYGFSKKQFMHATSIAGIRYIHIPELGVPSSLRHHLDTTSAYEQLFRYYETDILPQHREALAQLIDILKANGRAVLTCFEADPMCCHRHKITEYLANNSHFVIPIAHLRTTQSRLASTISLSEDKAPYGLLEENAVYSS